MIPGVPIPFSHDKFAAIGKAVWSSTVVEHELARTALQVRSNAATRTGNAFDKHVIQAIGGSLSGRYTEFTDALDVCEPWRNTMCHGKWNKSGEGQMSVRFLDRKSLKSEKYAEPDLMSIEKPSKISDTTLATAIEIADKAGTANQ